MLSYILKKHVILSGILNKVLFNQIGGKCCKIITNLYKGIKLEILANGKCSDFFNVLLEFDKG